VHDDLRAPHSHGPVPADFMIRGTHSICVSVRDIELMDEFMLEGWGGRRVAEDGAHVRYALGAGASGCLVDFVVEPQRAQGSWGLGEGSIHHMAFQVSTHAEQDAIKARLESMGLTDTSEVKDRGYFDSIYVRTPGGALFEATVSHNPSFTCDEPADRLGHEVIIAPQFHASRAELVAQLGVLRD
jgi:glyoxalase family protein